MKQSGAHSASDDAGEKEQQLDDDQCLLPRSREERKKEYIRGQKGWCMPSSTLVQYLAFLKSRGDRQASSPKSRLAPCCLLESRGVFIIMASCLLFSPTIIPKRWLLFVLMLWPLYFLRHTLATLAQFPPLVVMEGSRSRSCCVTYVPS